MGNRKKMVFYAGSFSPLHDGHKAVIKRLSKFADKVAVMVTPLNPLKDKYTMDPTEERERKLEEYVHSSDAPIEAFMIRFSPKELITNGKCYSYMALDALSAKYPEYDIYLAIGEDCFMEFERWEKWEYIASTYGVVVVSRKGYNASMRIRQARKEGKFKELMYLYDTSIPEMSSTEIRRERDKAYYDVLEIESESESVRKVNMTVDSIPARPNEEIRRTLQVWSEYDIPERDPKYMRLEKGTPMKFKIDSEDYGDDKLHICLSFDRSSSFLNDNAGKFIGMEPEIVVSVMKKNGLKDPSELFYATWYENGKERKFYPRHKEPAIEAGAEETEKEKDEAYYGTMNISSKDKTVREIPVTIYDLPYDADEEIISSMNVSVKYSVPHRSYWMSSLYKDMKMPIIIDRENHDDGRLHIVIDITKCCMKPFVSTDGFIGVDPEMIANVMKKKGLKHPCELFTVSWRENGIMKTYTPKFRTSDIKGTPLLVGEDASRFAISENDVKPASEREKEKAKDAFEYMESISDFKL